MRPLTEPAADPVRRSPSPQRFGDETPTLYVHELPSAGRTLVSLDATRPGNELALSPIAEEDLGRYRTGSELGRGGMGHVVEARDPLLLRGVAAKALREELAGDRGARGRFLAEAQITAQLEHPSIVPVYDIGTSADDRLYFVMKKVEGRSLRDILGGLQQGDPDVVQTWSQHRLLNVFLKACQAVAFAHARGVLHRDLKPGNIMVGAYGEVLVMDWGVAGRVGEDLVEVRPVFDKVELSRTGDGVVVGTPGYMSPEQVKAERGGIDGRSDVWSLGAILYELLTYQRVFDGDSAVAVFAATIAGSIRPPRFRAPEARIPDLLEQICMRALAHEPVDRYQSALALAEAVEEFLEGSQRRAQAAAMTERAREAWERHVGVGARRALLVEQEKRIADATDPWSPLEDRTELLGVRDQLARLEPQQARLFGEVVALCEKALAYDPGYLGARRVLADAYWARLEDAELRRHRADAAYYADRVSTYDDGQFADLLEGTGALTLRTDPPGVDVICQRYQDRAGIRHLGEPERLGVTPLDRYPLPMGSYLVTLETEGRPIRYPVSISRGRHWDSGAEPVPLSVGGELPSDLVYVPAGPFVCGGDPAAPGGQPRSEPWVDAYFIGRFPVTMGEYVEFLNVQHEQDRDAAWQRVPRSEASLDENRGQYFQRPGPRERYALPKTDWDGNPWEPRWPAFGVSWYDAVAYARWASERDGILYDLPTEREMEKAARGVDGRFYPWGDAFDRTLCKMADSRRQRARPEPVGAFPGDDSPYGARDLAGSMRDWCSDPTFDGDDGMRPVRGGSWNYDARFCRAACRLGRPPWRVFAYNGFRLVHRPRHGGGEG